MFAHLYSSDRSDSYFAVGYADYPLALVVGIAPEQLPPGEILPADLVHKRGLLRLFRTEGIKKTPVLKREELYQG
jgi:hypothetical protein